jgi:hypothetical protein
MHSNRIRKCGYTTNYLSVWSRVHLEKLTVSQSRNSPHFMEPEGSLPHSQVPATCFYPVPNESSAWPPAPSSFFLSILISSPIYAYECAHIRKILFPSKGSRPGRNLLECCVVHSPASSAEVKNECSYTSTPSVAVAYAFMTCAGTTLPSPLHSVEW